MEIPTTLEEGAAEAELQTTHPAALLALWELSEAFAAEAGEAEAEL